MSEDAGFQDRNNEDENVCVCCKIRMLMPSTLYPSGGLACSCSFEICICGSCHRCCRCTARFRRAYAGNIPDKVERAFINKQDIEFLQKMNIKY